MGFDLGFDGVQLGVGQVEPLGVKAEARPHRRLGARQGQDRLVGRQVAADHDDARDARGDRAGQDGRRVRERRVGQVAVGVGEQVGRRGYSPATVMRPIFTVGAAV